MIQPRGMGFKPHRNTYCVHGLVNPKDVSDFNRGVSDDALELYKSKGFKDPFVVCVEVSNKAKQSRVHSQKGRRRWVFRFFHQHQERILEDYLEELSNCDEEDDREDGIVGAILYEERDAKRERMTNRQYDNIRGKKA
jgi:hypothetical protein